jgi:hypothetical protein
MAKAFYADLQRRMERFFAQEAPSKALM